MRPARAHSCGCKSRRKLITANEAKRNCMRVTECGKEAWNINCEPMNKNHIEGRRDGTSWHNTAKSIGSVAEVNVAVVPGSNAFLPGELLAGGPARKSSEVILVENKPGVENCPVTQTPEVLAP